MFHMIFPVDVSGDLSFDVPIHLILHTGVGGREPRRGGGDN